MHYDLLRRLPHWMQPTFPVTAYIIRRADPQRHWLWRALGAGLGWLLLVGMLFASAALHRVGSYAEMFEPGEFVSFVVLYFPVLVLQIMTMLAILSQVVLIGLTPPGTDLNTQRDTWELAKVTSHGPELVTRGRFAALVYRMRSMIVLLVLVRAGFSMQVLADLVFSWDEFSAAVAQHAPGVAPGVAALLVAALLIALLAVLVTSALLMAALGLMISTAFRPRWVSGVAQQLVFLGLVIGFGTSMFTGWNALFGIRSWGIYAWLGGGRGVLAQIAIGDLGWRLTSLDALVTLMARVEYGIALAGPVLVIVLLELMVTRWLLAVASRYAARPERA